MKTLKLLFLPLLLAISLPSLNTGCSSLQSDPAKIQRMASVAQLAAYTGAAYDLADHPDHRQYFLSSKIALDSLLRSQNYDPIAFQKALSGLPIKELKGDKGAIIITGAILLWDEYAREAVSLDRSTYVLPVITAVRDGLQRALDQTAPNPSPSAELKLVPYQAALLQPIFLQKAMDAPPNPELRAAISSGEVCKIAGHNWRAGRPGEGNGSWFADYHPGITYRTCKICGTCQSQSESDWK